MIEDLIYKAWDNPNSKDIVQDVESVIDAYSDLDKKDKDKIVNEIYNISDRFLPNSIEWMDRVVGYVNKFVEVEDAQ